MKITLSLLVTGLLLAGGSVYADGISTADKIKAVEANQNWLEMAKNYGPQYGAPNTPEDKVNAHGCMPNNGKIEKGETYWDNVDHRCEASLNGGPNGNGVAGDKNLSDAEKIASVTANPHWAGLATSYGPQYGLPAIDAQKLAAFNCQPDNDKINPGEKYFDSQDSRCETSVNGGPNVQGVSGNGVQDRETRINEVLAKKQQWEEMEKNYGPQYGMPTTMNDLASAHSCMPNDGKIVKGEQYWDNVDRRCETALNDGPNSAGVHGNNLPTQAPAAMAPSPAPAEMASSPAPAQMAPAPMPGQ